MLDDEPSIAPLTDELAALARRIDVFRRSRPTAHDSEALLTELESAHEELRVADEEIRAQQEELDRLIQNQRTQRWSHERLVALLPAAVVVTDGQGLVSMANAAAAALLHVRVDRLLRKPIFAFLDEKERPHLRRLLARSLTTSSDFGAVASVVPRRGVAVRVELAATVRSDPVTGDHEITWVLLGRGTSQPRPEPLTGADVARTLVELTQLPVGGRDRGEALRRVAGLCQRAFVVPVAVSIGLGNPAHPKLVASDSALAQSVDGAQITAGEGPAELAWQSDSVVASTDLAVDDRWPRLAMHLSDLDMRSVVVAPVRIGDTIVGTLSVYSNADVTEDPVVRETAELLAPVIAAVVHESEVKNELETVARQLEQALESRATIDQAKGVLMATQGCGPDEAFRLLARISSDRNIKVRDLAHDLVEEVRRGWSFRSGRDNGGADQGPGLAPRR